MAEHALAVGERQMLPMQIKRTPIFFNSSTQSCGCDLFFRLFQHPEPTITDQ
jgi:hypothetical protein